MSKIVLQVTGMTCQGCVNSVERIVKKTDPQALVSIDLKSGRVEADTSTTADLMAKAISAAGYEARVA